MTLLPYLALAAAVGANNFAATVALGALGQGKRWARVLLVFGVVEFVIPLIGLAIGQASAAAIGQVADWLGPLLLLGLGLWVLRSGGKDRAKTERAAARATTWGGLLLFSLGLALDNLVVGYSLGLVAAEPIRTAAVMAAGAVTAAALGLKIGATSRRNWDTAATRLAGVLLLAMGVAMVFGWL